jgi:DNA-binding LytR/AlgR family response regulator
MKPTILTQKNVCAFLGFMMALTILWSAKAEAKVEQINEVIPMELKEGFEITQEEEMIPEFIFDVTDIKTEPTITFINKYGEVVAEFYGEKSELEKKFKETFEKGKLLTSYGKHEFYLIG